MNPKNLIQPKPTTRVRTKRRNKLLIKPTIVPKLTIRIDPQWAAASLQCGGGVVLYVEFDTARVRGIFVEYLCGVAGVFVGVLGYGVGFLAEVEVSDYDLCGGEGGGGGEEEEGWEMHCGWGLIVKFGVYR
ncbi:hypothetical protein TWF718_005193 [Orbilia javanica]|uniref:Uncharacterized protein n=1 Tax=Orbilia javanica TaxID=47235 RepID=A0AAN8RLL5_9PEZI